MAYLSAHITRSKKGPVPALTLRVLGVEPIGSSAAELAAQLRTEDAKWAEAARAAGLVAE